ncbi:class I SAM-dependent methyltransferase [Modestobacter roseus]|uniref:FkbM family methyltransferase n=1 Tax=Modestobacter roseus TaxID=1181884 RepID=A0A562IUY2_9ACTN|nr:class I SAM-dependent methyltransferase [Modestobacter roseus]TWH74758.1 FkbM family methyltransferase [Modestobacter roseus]
MSPAFAGPTASHYRRHRRDVPGPLLDRLAAHVGLAGDAVVLDLGAGTGQVAVPLTARAGAVLAVEPEPDMLAQLRRRGEEEGLRTLLCVLAADRDVPTLLGTLGRCDLLTVANALHWMDAPALFEAAHRGLAPSGAIAVITHGIPLWLGGAAWAKAVNAYLADWFGRPLTAGCGSDEEALRDRQGQLEAAGFADVAVLRHHYQADVDADHVIGHLYSALDADVLPTAHRPRFEDGLRAVLNPFVDAPMQEDVPVTALVGRR